jgi:hypothetical protein
MTEEQSIMARSGHIALLKPILAVGLLCSVLCPLFAQELPALPTIPAPRLERPHQQQVPQPLPPTRVKTTVRQDDPKDEDTSMVRPERTAWSAWVPPGQPMSLAQCLEIGQQRQPAIQAAVASLAASERGYLALFGLRRIADILSPDLPVRKQQACRGLDAARAEVLKAQQENTYDITFLYYSYVYATQQEQTASEIVEQLEAVYDNAVEILKQEIIDPRIKINEFTLGKIDDVISEVRDLRSVASNGRLEAMAGLREAMGVGDEFDFYPADKELPIMNGMVDLDSLLAMAFANRPEMTQIAVVVDVTRLEVCAQQALSRRQTAQTFASGTDLHARILPAPLRNGVYRPGAVPPEMPTQLVGQVADRVAKAEAYLAHQVAAQDKVHGLIRLECKKALTTWTSAVQRVKEAKARHERAQRLVEKSRAAAAANMDQELLVTNESLASRAQSQYVKAVYELIHALATLERVSGGAIKPAFPGR